MCFNYQFLKSKYNYLKKSRCSRYLTWKELSDYNNVKVKDC